MDPLESHAIRRPHLPARVTVYEVGPRDGLQNEAETLSVDAKVAFVDQLTESGLRAIEVGSFVSKRSIPQLADTEEVFRRIRRASGVRYPALVPNLKGLERALQAGVLEIAVFTAASPSRRTSAATPPLTSFMLPASSWRSRPRAPSGAAHPALHRPLPKPRRRQSRPRDRKSTRLNSSH